MGERKAYIVVIIVQLIYTGMFLLSKAAFNVGMNNFVFVFYRQAFATLFLAPLSLFFEWKNAPPLSFVTLLKIFLLSLCGITLSLDVYGIALVKTSATLAAATSNCLPVITFFLALLLRMEVLKWRTSAGMAKLVGIGACLGGAATLALFKGPHLRLSCHHHMFGGTQSDHTIIIPSSNTTWIKGVFLMLMSNTFWGLWLVLQGSVLKSFPSKLLFTTLQCFFSSIQSLVIAVGFVRDHRDWILGWNIRLVAVLYCGIMVTGITFYLQAWVIEKKGPVFLAMSTPLNLIFTILCSAFLLCEIITTGSIVGGILLVMGLYCVLWGKNKEKINDQTCTICPPPQLHKLQSFELKHIVPKEQSPV
ncbi:nodulin MtN21 /EamA-like transporter family protein [Euphorbia peplus]|nr:nodulin MtN21 /EamA-like transporter family protein [Euphorbia peplus]